MSASVLGALSPAHIFTVEDLLLAFRAYFDGAHKQPRAMTLSCVAANDEAWKRLESVWLQTLRENGEPAYLHMTDLWACQGMYRGWDEYKRDKLLNALWSALNSFMDDRWVHSFSTRIDLRLWQKYRHINSLPTPARLCARIVFPEAIEWLYRPECGVFVDVMDAFFDRNEPFIHHIRADWASDKIRKKYPFWNLVRIIEPADSKLTPGLQMADMICWGFHRQGTYDRPRPWEYDDAGYMAAVRCANALRGIYIEITEQFLRESRVLEEGQARIELWKKKGASVPNPSDEFTRFDRMMKRLVNVPHDKLKTALEAEKQKKKRRTKRSSASRAPGASRRDSDDT